MTRWFKRPSASSSAAAGSRPQPLLPADAEPGPIAVGAADGAADPTALAFADIVTELINRHLMLGRRGLVLCGASMGTGVSFTAANLSATLAYTGVQTLLIEADLRAPTQAAAFDLGAGEPGLLQYLTADADRADIVTLDVLPNLSVVLAGGTAPDADDLLAGDRFRNLVRDCMRDYGCVIVDTPPANRFADVRTVAAAVGYAVIVGRNDFTYLDDVQLLSEQLNQVGVAVVGSIFNAG